MKMNQLLVGSLICLFAGGLGTSCAEDDAPTAAVIVDECDEASACGARQYCGDGVSQICILTAEGTHRCGEIPSSCGVPQCATSADCSALGPDYFCDTPASGCCDAAGEEVQRCVKAVTLAPDAGVIPATE